VLSRELKNIKSRREAGNNRESSVKHIYKKNVKYEQADNVKQVCGGSF
jgi:hypothetical protein